MTDTTHKRIFLVYDMDDGKVITSRESQHVAFETAKRLATEFLGHTIVVFSPEEAFKAAPVVSKIYLPWPKSEADSVSPPKDKEPANG